MTAAPEPDDAQTPADFVSQLRRLKAWSGLSYRDIERRARAAGEVLPSSTVASALSRASLPHVHIVMALVRACGVGTEQADRWVQARKTIAQAQADRAGRERPVTPAEPVAAPPHEPTPTRAGVFAAYAVPCLLPPKAPRFVGRDTESAAVVTALHRDTTTPATVLVTGPAGVGKTTFAIRAAHAVAGEFPDGQLYADLRGASAHPAEAAEVLSTFLRALGITGVSLPVNHAERVHLYRTLGARRRLLIVLDDAVGSQQIRDLLPNGPGCATIITSRTSLADLDGSRVPLAVLAAGDAMELLRAMVGEQRTDAEPGTARAIVDQCGRLPLAVWIAGARLAARPHLSLTDMARALSSASRRLDTLTVGDFEVRASLELSFQSLRPRARRLFRLLALAPGDFASWVAAALLDTSPADAEFVLDDLVEVHLLECVAAAGQTRYQLHDLVRAFAEERCAATEDEPARQAATIRMLGAAVQLAETGEARLSADFQGISGHRLPHWRLPATDRDRLLQDPLAWFDREHRFLTLVTERGLRSAGAHLAACLATSLTTFFQIRGHFDDWQRLQTRALATARRDGDHRGATKLHRALGELATILDRYPEAVSHFEQALDGGAIEDPEYTASATAGLGYVYRLLGRYADATVRFTRAADLARRTANLNCLVYVTNGLGVVALEQGDPDTAQRRFIEGLGLSRSGGYRPGEAQALRCIGLVHRGRHEYAEAAAAFEQARQISLDLGDRLGATHAASWLGDVLHRQGQHGRGQRILAESLWTYREHANVWGEAATLYCLAEAYLAAGLPARAAHRAETAVRIWRRISAPYWLATGLDTLGRARFGLGDTSTAESMAAEARQLRAQLRSPAPSPR